jgi:diaminopimelate epimerase
MTQMQFSFYKYQGAANDFVLLDNRKGLISKDPKLFEAMCHRRTGIGADGVILIENHPDFDFQMYYANSDGKPSSMCGNGGRCVVAFAHFLQIISDNCTFLAIDGKHEASITEGGLVSLGMNNVDSVVINQERAVLDTGSPHYIAFTENVKDIDVFTEGRSIRNSSEFKAEGINVNFIEYNEHDITIRTYERGVEDETWSCGTGVCAAAIATAIKNKEEGRLEYRLMTLGGVLSVRFQLKNGKATNVTLIGPAKQVFQGEYGTKETEIVKTVFKS